MTPSCSPQLNQRTMFGLSFNQSKSKHQTLTRKLVPVASSYKLDDTIISSTDNEKDLGVWVSSDLTWKKTSERADSESQQDSGIC